jgi:hypothetical protein
LEVEDGLDRVGGGVDTGRVAGCHSMVLDGGRGRRGVESSLKSFVCCIEKSEGCNQSLKGERRGIRGRMRLGKGELDAPYRTPGRARTSWVVAEDAREELTADKYRLSCQPTLLISSERLTSTSIPSGTSHFNNFLTSSFPPGTNTCTVVLPSFAASLSVFAFPMSTPVSSRRRRAS